jgi:hypothetical protein
MANMAAVALALAGKPHRPQVILSRFEAINPRCVRELRTPAPDRFPRFASRPSAASRHRDVSRSPGSSSRSRKHRHHHEAAWLSSMMHKHSEEQNDRKGNSDQPKQYAFSERHGSLRSMVTEQATHSGSIGSVAGFPCRARSQAAANPVDRSTQRTNREGRHCSAWVRKEFVREAPGTISRPGVQYDREIVRERARPRH